MEENAGANSRLLVSHDFSWLKRLVTICRKYGQNRWGGLVRGTFESVGIHPPGSARNTPMAEINPDDQLDKANFEELLSKIDSGLRALPATAQVAPNPRSAFFTKARTSVILSEC